MVSWKWNLTGVRKVTHTHTHTQNILTDKEKNKFHQGVSSQWSAVPLGKMRHETPLLGNQEFLPEQNLSREVGGNAGLRGTEQRTEPEEEMASHP